MLDAESFAAYLAHLRWLVDTPSPFTQPDAVEGLMRELQARFEILLPGHAWRRDEAGNLLGVPRDLHPAEPLVVLSAHADTVPTEAARWAPPFRPVPHWENEAEIVGQGINDCKAGVAAQLWLAEAFGRAAALRNVIFSVTFKEEGAGRKTGVAIGAAFGRALPAPPPGSTLLVLENTVSVERARPLVYTTEASSYTIRLEGPLPELQDRQRTLPEWRPVAIAPVAGEPEWSFVDYPPLGHVCTAPPEKNPLARALAAAGPEDLLIAGDERSLGTVPARIGFGALRGGARHRLTLTKRGPYPLAATRAELAPFAYTPVKPLELSAGFAADHRRGAAAVGRAFVAAVARGHAEFAANPGASDATIITAAMMDGLRENFLPIVCGPGSRAQREARPPRFTHGPNETFVKAPGRAALALLCAVLREAGHLR